MGLAPYKFDLTKPIKFVENPAIDVWQAQSSIQVAVVNVGYKRGDGYKEDNKSQQVLYAREGKQETQNLFDTLRRVIPTHCVVSQADLEEKKMKVLDHVWLYGNGPSMREVSCTPNGLAMMKALAMGETKWILMECSSLAAALRQVWVVDSLAHSTLVDNMP